MSERRARDAARGRGADRCELCGSPDGVQASHRIGRAQGGPWTPPNVLALCARDHAWLTEHRDAANAGGWILKDLDYGADLTEQPVWLSSAGLWEAGWHTLDGDGTAHPLDDDRPPPAAFPPGVQLTPTAGAPRSAAAPPAPPAAQQSTRTDPLG